MCSHCTRTNYTDDSTLYFTVNLLTHLDAGNLGCQCKVRPALAVRPKTSEQFPNQIFADSQSTKSGPPKCLKKILIPSSDQNNYFQLRVSKKRRREKIMETLTFRSLKCRLFLVAWMVMPHFCWRFSLSTSTLISSFTIVSS